MEECKSREIDRLLAEGKDPFAQEQVEKKPCPVPRIQKGSFRTIFSAELKQINENKENK